MTSPCVSKPELTRTAPVRKIATMARLMITYVTGFNSADTRPTKRCICSSAAFFSENACCSRGSIVNARITRTPSRFSRAAPSTPSSPPCTFLYSGVQVSKIANTTANNIGIATTNTSAAFASTVKAITIAPNTTKGDRSSSRSARFTPVCT